MGQYDRVDFRGEPATRRQRAALLYCELDRDIKFEFDVLQGSWQNASGVSSTTHTGAGVLDVWWPGIGDNAFSRMVIRVLRGKGKQAAFLRGPGQFGGFTWHCHMCDLDTRGMDSLAIFQVGDYKNVCDGLGSGGSRDPLPWRPDDYRPFNFDMWQRYVDANADVRKLIHRVEEKRDSLQDLQRQLERARNQRNRLLNH